MSDPRSTEESNSPVIVDIGAGQNPDPEATVTIDVREDIDEIDHPGVRVGVDPLPFDDDSVDHIVANDVIEHISPDDLDGVWEEFDRVLGAGGSFRLRMPHTGTYASYTNPTHRGVGGATPFFDHFFTEPGELWADYDWDVESYAVMEWPILVRPEWRLRYRTGRAAVSTELAKLPFVSGYVIVTGKKH